MAGAVAVCTHWDWEYGPVLACQVTKIASRLAFQREGRSLTAPTILQELPKAINML